MHLEFHGEGLTEAQRSAATEAATNVGRSEQFIVL